MKLSDLGFFNTPVGARPVLGMRNELGDPVYRDVGGNTFDVMPNPAPPGPGLIDAIMGVVSDPMPTLRALPRGLLDAAVSAGTAPARAARGEPVTYGDAFDTAGLAFMGSAGGLAPAEALTSGIPWRERLESSIPRAWLDSKYDRDNWHPISSVSSNRTDLDAVHEPTGTLSPEQLLQLDDILNSTLIPAYGDRTAAGVNVQGVGDLRYSDPVRSLGGADFMREQGTGLWANAGTPARSLARNAQRVLEDGGDPLMAFTAMGAQSGDFSTMMARSILNQIDPDRMDPAAVARFDERVRSQVPSFEGLTAPDLERRLFDGHTGSQRWQMWQEMDKAAYRDAGLPDVGLARRAITDPRQLDATPFDTGLTIGRMNGEVIPPGRAAVEHPSYNTQLGGDYIGGITPLPGPIVWRDFFETRRNAGASPGADQKSFMGLSSNMTQVVDQQMIDEANELAEYLRGMNDPTSPLRLWQRQ